MGEVQERRYVRRICSKSCVSGKSLGGHMRVHLAQISASKKGEIKLDCDDQDGTEDSGYQLRESCANQSNSGVARDGKIKHCESNLDFGNGDQSNSYELRENPKKSWRISHPKHGLIKNSISCKECGKEFTSLRAVSGHMRCHSSKNKKENEAHCCKECGRGFDSMRAMFGHMKSHSKKGKVSVVESAESLSDLENFCSFRRKRSRIRYKGTVNPSFSSVDASNSSVSELEEAEAAAKCLMMLSKGVGNCLKLDSVTESSDDDSAYFGAASSCKSKRFFSDDEKKLMTSLSAGKPQLECCFSGYANAITTNNVSEFDGLDLNFVSGDHTKSDPDVAHELLRDENGTKASFLCDDGIPSVDHTLLEYEQSDELVVTLESADDLGSVLPSKSRELDKDFLVANSDESGLEKPENKHGLSSRKAKHKMQSSSSNLCVNAKLLSVSGDDHLQLESGGVSPSSLESSKSKEHECPICFKAFSSGQALGGHRRAHYNGVAESKIAMNLEVAGADEMLDLNFPFTGDAGARSRLGLSSWFADRNCENEVLVLTT